MHQIQISMFFLLGLSSTHLLAGPIGVEDFGDSASIQTFSSLGSLTSSYTAPLPIGTDLFDGDDHHLRSSDKFGPLIGRSGTAISNNPSLSNADVGFIEILLGKPAIRTGVYVGAEFPWSAHVEFYDVQDNLLGVLPISGDGNDNEFAGWNKDAEWINRILVVDTTYIGNNNPLIVDDFIQEIPEPEALVMSLLFLLFSDSGRPARDKSS